MSNYLYTDNIKDRGGKELDFREYTQTQLEQSVYIEKFLAKALIEANCGWENLLYKVIRYPSGLIDSYMVLYAKGNPDGRCIRITDNSMGRNLQVLGENIF